MQDLRISSFSVIPVHPIFGRFLTPWIPVPRLREDKLHGNDTDCVSPNMIKKFIFLSPKDWFEPMVFRNAIISGKFSPCSLAVLSDAVHFDFAQDTLREANQNSLTFPTWCAGQDSPLTGAVPRLDSDFVLKDSSEYSIGLRTLHGSVPRFLRLKISLHSIYVFIVPS
ncbi:MAG: hypothetical protein UY62_C0041G0001 [Parcubacteria group bacterium GW2011_GWF2_50_9]|nr:MAG: hypothetical protein UY62_C0041G0001 [Parcubacteria group bacterium GW2011_GWF2_50_9]